MDEAGDTFLPGSLYTTSETEGTHLSKWLLEPHTQGLAHASSLSAWRTTPMPASSTMQEEGLPHPPSPRALAEPILNRHWLNGCEAGSYHTLSVSVINQTTAESISGAIGIVLGKMCALLIRQWNGRHSSGVYALNVSRLHSSSFLE